MIVRFEGEDTHEFYYLVDRDEDTTSHDEHLWLMFGDPECPFPPHQEYMNRNMR